MKFEIKHRYSGAVLFALECGSLKLCLQAAVESKAYLRDAYLGDADLRGAYLRDAYLGGAYLGGAYLRDAYLGDAYLGDADLGGAEPATPEQSIANLDKVREIILDNTALLEMDHWHDGHGWKDRTCAEEAVCGTTHCLAGWLQVCSTDKTIRELPTNIAGTLMAPVASRMFYQSASEVLDWLTKRDYVSEAQERPE